MICLTGSYRTGCCIDTFRMSCIWSLQTGNLTKSRGCLGFGVAMGRGGLVGCGRLVLSSKLSIVLVIKLDFCGLLKDVILSETNTLPLKINVHVLWGNFGLFSGAKLAGFVSGSHGEAVQTWHRPQDLMARLQCCVCMEAPRCTLLEPCSHYALCFSCARKMTQCPLCRRKITSIQCTLSGWIVEKRRSRR